MSNVNYFFDTSTKPSDLLNHNLATDLKLRILNTLSGASLMGVVAQETRDSFLVILPSRLLENGIKRVVEPHVPVRFGRFQKSTILSTIPCFGEFEAYYIQYLLTTGMDVFPEFFKPVYIKKLTKRLLALKVVLDKLNEEAELKKKKLKEESETATVNTIPAQGSTKYRH